MSVNFIMHVSVLIIILAGLLFFYQRKTNKNIIYLSSFLILYALQTIASALVLFEGPLWLFTILLVHFVPLYYLSPVLFYFSVRAAINDSLRLKYRDLLHLIPFLLFLVGSLPYFFTSLEYKSEVAAKLMGDFDAYMNFRFGLFYDEHVNHFARPILWIIYMIASLVSVGKFLPTYRSSIGNIFKQYRFVLQSITLAILVFSLHAVVQLIVNINFHFGKEIVQSYDHVKMLLHLSAVLYLFIPFYMLIHPRFLYGLPQTVPIPINPDSVLLRGENGNPKSGATKTKPVSDNENFNLLTEEILEFITSNKPYLNEKFSVVDLCTQMNVPRHHVQYCLNVILNKSFSELKNEMRVKHAMELMKKNTSNNLTIEGIGRKSGFASNSNFYSEFKEMTGMTPSKWMENHAAKPEESSTPFR